MADYLGRIESHLLFWGRGTCKGENTMFLPKHHYPTVSRDKFTFSASLIIKVDSRDTMSNQ
jgi:hypothetical protein